MKSAFYRGHVRHSRFEPTAHSFRFPLCMAYLDLDELDQTFGPRWLWSYDRRNLASFRRADYFGETHRPLKECIQEAVHKHTGARPSGPVRLLTHPRYWGVRMNPISLYYCFAENGRDLEAVVGEVTNTPWDERHVYVLSAEGASPGEQVVTQTPKTFHVSPFMGMDLDYAWNLSLPEDSLSLEIANLKRDGSRLFDVELTLDRFEWTPRQCRRALWQYPFQTGQVAFGIYWQALKLFWKGAPFHSHPGQFEGSLEENT